MKGRCLQLTKPGQVPFHVGVPIAVRLEGVPAGLGVSVTDDAGNFYNRVESGGFITLGKGGKAATCISVCFECEELPPNIAAIAFEGVIEHSPRNSKFAGFR
jgi:hypothetical protein